MTKAVRAKLKIQQNAVEFEKTVREFRDTADSQDISAIRKNTKSSDRIIKRFVKTFLYVRTLWLKHVS